MIPGTSSAHVLAEMHAQFEHHVQIPKPVRAQWSLEYEDEQKQKYDKYAMEQLDDISPNDRAQDSREHAHVQAAW